MNVVALATAIQGQAEHRRCAGGRGQHGGSGRQFNHSAEKLAGHGLVVPSHAIAEQTHHLSSLQRFVHVQQRVDAAERNHSGSNQRVQLGQHTGITALCSGYIAL